MSEKNQFYQLKNIKETKQVLADNPKFRTVYFQFDVGKGLPKHSHNGYATIYVIKGEISTAFRALGSKPGTKVLPGAH